MLRFFRPGLFIHTWVKCEPARRERILILLVLLFLAVNVVELMATCFAYEHATPDACRKAGCTRGHLVLKELAESIGRGWVGDRKGLNLRDRIRPCVVIGRSIKGSIKVPDAQEIARNRANSDRKDLRRDKTVGSESITLASLSTKRKEWYWHAGDPVQAPDI